MFATRQIDFIGAALLAIALLLPVADPPWNSFWREWTAAVAVLLIVLGALSRMRFDRRAVGLDVVSLPTVALLLAIVPWLQWAAGIEFYRGDAMLVSAYLLAFAVCIVMARSMAPDERARLADRLAIAMLVAALLSVPLAVLQWLGLLRLDLGIKVVAGRPVAHMEQTNLLCSLLIQGVLGAWRLRERGRLGSRPFAVFAMAMLVTMVLTQSRVAWLVACASFLAWLWRRRALKLPLRSGWVFVVAVLVLAAGAIAMPLLDARLGLTGVALADRLTGGRRPDAWALFLDAVGSHPWVGWGALQNGAAQFAMSLNHPPLLWLFTSAHDFVLDLMVWFGAPVGLIAGGALLLAVWRGVSQSPDLASFITALAAMALVLHGLVELPLQYTYFLLPLGLMIGIAGRAVGSTARSWRLPTQGAGSLVVLAVVPALFLALLAREYIPLGDVRPFMTYDKAANHMHLGASADIPNVMLLDQLKAFQVFASQPLVSGISPAILSSLRKPMLRYPFAPSQEHYAHLMALNGHSAEALDTLQRSCTFMTRPQCDENRRAWTVWRGLGESLPAWP